MEHIQHQGTQLTLTSDMNVRRVYMYMYMCRVGNVKERDGSALTERIPRKTMQTKRQMWQPP